MTYITGQYNDKTIRFTIIVISNARDTGVLTCPCTECFFIINNIVFVSHVVKTIVRDQSESMRGEVVKLTVIAETLAYTLLTNNWMGIRPIFILKKSMYFEKIYVFCIKCRPNLMVILVRKCSNWSCKLK